MRTLDPSKASRLLPKVLNYFDRESVLVCGTASLACSRASAGSTWRTSTCTAQATAIDAFMLLLSLFVRSRRITDTGARHRTCTARLGFIDAKAPAPVDFSDRIDACDRKWAKLVRWRWPCVAPPRLSSSAFPIGFLSGGDGKGPRASRWAWQCSLSCRPCLGRRNIAHRAEFKPTRKEQTKARRCQNSFDDESLAVFGERPPCCTRTKPNSHFAISYSVERCPRPERWKVNRLVRGRELCDQTETRVNDWRVGRAPSFVAERAWAAAHW